MTASSSLVRVVRHLDASSRNWGRRDRFRLEVRGGGQAGEREIWAELRGGREGEEEERRGRKKGGAGAEESRPESQQRALYPLLVPTQPQLQIPSSTGRPVRGVASWWILCGRDLEIYLDWAIGQLSINRAELIVISETSFSLFVFRCAQCITVGGVFVRFCVVCYCLDAPPPHRQQLCGSTLSACFNQSEACMCLHPR